MPEQPVVFLWPKGTEYVDTHDSLPTLINWDLWKRTIEEALEKRDK